MAQENNVDWSAFVGSTVHFRKPGGPPGPIPDGWTVGQIISLDQFGFITIKEPNGDISLISASVALSQILLV